MTEKTEAPRKSGNWFERILRLVAAYMLVDAVSFVIMVVIALQIMFSTRPQVQLHPERLAS